MARTSTIPKIFQKSEGGYLDECIMCQKKLLKPDSEYIIEKAIKRYPELIKTEVIFEYAMCMNCAEKMRNELSEESKRNIEQYFLAHVDFANRQKLINPKRARLNQWISNCLLSNKPVSQSMEFSLYGHAQGKRMIYDVFPYSISGEVMEEVNELLSEKTREVLDDFIGRHFSGPPEVADILKRRPLLV